MLVFQEETEEIFESWAAPYSSRFGCIVVYFGQARVRAVQVHGTQGNVVFVSESVRSGLPPHTFSKATHTGPASCLLCPGHRVPGFGAN